MALTHIALVKAEYAYSPQTEDELELEEDALYYLLEDDDAEWHKVMLKTSPSSSDPPKIGLVPATYILPAPVLQTMMALYAYEAQTDDELTISEDEIIDLYEEDGDWSLVGRQGDQESRGVGYVPTSYIEAIEKPNAGSSSAPAATDAMISPRDTTMNSNRPDSAGVAEVKTWAVTDIDQKKKRKGTLGIGNGALIFASESDKTGVQQYSLSKVRVIRTEKGKHLILQCENEERHFQVASQDLDEMVSRIEQGHQALSTQATPTSTPSKIKGVVSPTTSLTPSFRPPSAMANPDRPSGQNGRKVSFVEPVGKPATALYDFDAQGDDELTVREGERIHVLDDTSDDDWWKCSRMSNGEEGVVPATYIETDEGQPSGNPEAADAAMTAAAADEAKRRRVQEEEDARLAQQLADQEDSDYHRANARVADRKLVVAREAEQNRLLEAEAAARRKRESEARSTQRREAERAMTNPGLATGPTPPKLTARPDSAQGNRIQPGGPAPPKRPESAPREGKTKPQGQIRTWRDRTGQFKVEAEFRGLQNGKIRLHKLNGVIIEVPLSKMSNEDVIWLEGATGRSLRGVDPDDLPLAKLAIKNSSGPSGASKPSSSTSATSKRPSGPTKKPTDWFDFFLSAGCDLDDCTRYATNFERDRIDESLLTELEPATMRNLGLREGDVIRVKKHIKSKHGSSPSGPGNPQDEQIRKDEELARQLSGQSPSSGHNIFTSGPNGSLKTTRRGRPTPNRTGSSTVDLDTLTTAREMLSEAPPPAATPQILVEPISEPANPGAKLASSGFDDDAWTVRPNSTTPQIPVSQSTTPSHDPAPVSNPAPVPAPAPAPLIEMATPQASTPQSSLTDQIYEKIMNHGQQARAPVSAPPAPPSLSHGPSMMVSQPTGFNPNGPRGPLAPVASNAPLLNPLIPTNTGMTGFIPTRPIQSQPTGFVPQQQLMQHNMMTGMSSQPTTMAMQPTGMGPQSMMGNGTLQPQGMGMMQPQATGMGFMQSQPTGMGIGMGISPQMTGYAPGFQSAPPPPVPSIPSAYSSAPQSMPAKSFNPSDVFASMKTGQFTSGNGDAGPQDPNKYNALRAPQTPVGMMGTANNSFTQQFMPTQPGMIQPLQPQPTGFAPGGYIMSQQTGMPMQNNMMYPNQQQQQQQQQQQWRGY